MHEKRFRKRELDYLYSKEGQNAYPNIDRKMADAILLQRLLNNPHVERNDAYAIYAAVRTFGFSFLNLPPVANAGGPYTLSEGVSLQLNGSGSADPEDGTALTYEWDLNYDGFTFDVNANGVQISMSFADNFATRTIALRVTDSGGLSHIAATTIEVTNAVPVLDTLSATSEYENGIVHLTGTYHDDGTHDTHTLTINWREGALQTVVVTGGSFDITHQYLDDNPTGTASDMYTISVTLTDDDMGSVPGSTTTTITNLAPVVAAVAGPSAGVQGTWTSFTGVRGQEIDFSSSFSDVGTLDTHDVSWNFGDGTVIAFHSSNSHWRRMLNSA